MAYTISAIARNKIRIITTGATTVSFKELLPSSYTVVAESVTETAVGLGADDTFVLGANTYEFEFSTDGVFYIDTVEGVTNKRHLFICTYDLDVELKEKVLDAVVCCTPTSCNDSYAAKYYNFNILACISFSYLGEDNTDITTDYFAGFPATKLAILKYTADAIHRYYEYIDCATESPNSCSSCS